MVSNDRAHAADPRRRARGGDAMTDEPMTREELTENLKRFLKHELETVQPMTVRDTRLMAIRLAERLSSGNVETKNRLYDIFIDMMGIGSKA